MVIYNRDKKELIIPTGFGYDCSDIAQSARTEGYNEGKEDGMTIVRSHFSRLYKNPRWEDVQPEGTVWYLPSAPTEAYDKVIIDYNGIYQDGYNEGLYSATTVPVQILLQYGTEDGCDAFILYGIYGCRNLKLNGISVDCDDQTSLNCFNTLYTCASTYTIPSITSISVEGYPGENVETLDINDVTRIVINDGDAEILTKSIEYLGEQFIPFVGDRKVYRLNFTIKPFGITSYGEGWDDGYTSGYTDGISAERPTSSTAFTENGVYTTSGGWNQVIVNVHCSGTPEPSLQKKEIIVDNFYHYLGNKIVVTPDEGYDGLSAVTVSAVTTDEVVNIIDLNVTAAEGYLQNDILDAGSAITITENGIYTPSGMPINRGGVIYEFPNSAGTQTVYFNWNIPNYFKSIEVNVTTPHWNNYCSGTFRTDTTKVWSTEDENQICFFESMFPVITFDHLKVDGVPLLGYCTAGLTMQAGQHTFLLDMDGLRDDPDNLWAEDKPFKPINEFPNLDGNITYNFYRKQIQ